jgi:anti-sigma B factor antagonist
MDVVSTTNGAVARVRVRGDVDTATSPGLDQELHRLFDSGVREVVIDLSAVSFLSSAGLSVLIGTQRDLMRLTIEPGNNIVDRLIGLTGLERLYGAASSVHISSPPDESAQQSH